MALNPTGTVWVFCAGRVGHTSTLCGNAGRAESEWGNGIPYERQGRRDPHPRPLMPAGRFRANAAQVRQSRPDFGLSFQVGVHKTFQVVPSSLGGASGDSLKRQVRRSALHHQRPSPALAAASSEALLCLIFSIRGSLMHHQRPSSVLSASLEALFCLICIIRGPLL